MSTNTKPSSRAADAQQKGLTVLRPQIRYAGKHPYKKEFWVIAEYTGNGWGNWSETLHYKTREQAQAEIAKACSANSNLVTEADLL